MKHRKHYTLAYIDANTPANTARAILEYVANQINMIGNKYFPSMGCQYWANTIYDDINLNKYNIDNVNRHIREYNEFCRSFQTILQK